MTLLFVIVDSTDGGSDDNNGVNIVLVTLLAIAVIGLVISVVINVCLVVQRKQSRFVVFLVYIPLYVA